MNILDMKKEQENYKNLFKLRSVNMKAIEVKDLSKTFKVKLKDKGLKGSIKSIFKWRIYY